VLYSSSSSSAAWSIVSTRPIIKTLNCKETYTASVLLLLTLVALLVIFGLLLIWLLFFGVQLLPFLTKKLADLAYVMSVT
jgi:hypothetical protein